MTFSKDALELLAEANAIDEALKALEAGTRHELATGLVALPERFKVHDLERSLKHRRRLRGHMTTSVLKDFADYVDEHKDEIGAAVFVDERYMSATAVLNLGNPEIPGHADNTATLDVKATAAYAAMGSITSGPRKQTGIAEWLEDWGPHLGCFALNDDGDTAPLELKTAIRSVRNIKIEDTREAGSEQKNLGARRSLVESTQVKDTDSIPARIKFKCVPYLGLAERTFELRLGVITGVQGPQIQLRVINLEKHQEEMAAEMANLVRDAVSDMPVHIGSYTPNTE